MKKKMNKIIDKVAEATLNWADWQIALAEVVLAVVIIAVTVLMTAFIASCILRGISLVIPGIDTDTNTFMCYLIMLAEVIPLYVIVRRKLKQEA